MTSRSDLAATVGEAGTGQVGRFQRASGSGVGAVLAVASLIMVAFMGSVILTPLYSLYQVKFGFSELVLTLVYAVYVVGNIAALLVFGRVSDQVGRKRVAIPALGVAAVSALFFLFAQGTVWLFVGRLLIGLAVGVLSGTGTAWLAERYGPRKRSTATVAAAAANLSGIALGPLVGGVLAQYAPDPLRLPFLAYLGVLVIVGVAIVGTADRGQRTGAGLGELTFRPRIGVPRDRLHLFVPPAIAGFVTFALAGLYFALIPGIVIHDLHDTNVAVGGLIVFELGACAVAGIILGRGIEPGTAMTAGLIVLLPAVVLVVAAQAAGSMPLLLTAAAVGGITMAVGYRGSLEVVNEIAPDDRRAEVTSSYYIACFVGNSVPVIGVGVLSTLTDPLTASIVFACTIGSLSAAALAWRRRAPTAPTET